MTNMRNRHATAIYATDAEIAKIIDILYLFWV